MALRRFTFQISPTESIPWVFDREHLVGEEVTLDHHGVFHVTRRPPRNGDPHSHGAFVVERVRRATAADLKAQVARGINRLPPVPPRRGVGRRGERGESGPARRP
jgi:hypothetical protein